MDNSELKSTNDLFSCHVFVCTNSRENKVDCASKGAEKLRSELKTWAHQFGKKVRINSSGCLGQCEAGIATVAYPAGHWKLNAKATDTEVLKNWIQDLVKSPSAGIDRRDSTKEWNK